MGTKPRFGRPSENDSNSAYQLPNDYNRTISVEKPKLGRLHGNNSISEKNERKDSISSISSASSSTSSSSSSSSNGGKNSSNEPEIIKNGLKLDPTLPISPLENAETRPSPKSWGRKVKSLDMSNYRLERNSSSSSSSDSVSKKGKGLSKSNLTDSFLKRLNRSYEPVYLQRQLRKVNSFSQTDDIQTRFHTK